MQEIWKFSPSSLPLLQRCLDLAVENNVNNKWQKVFKKNPKVNKDFKEESLASSVVIIEDSPMQVVAIENSQIHESAIEDSPRHIVASEKYPNSEDQRHIFEMFENNVEEKIEFIIQECVKSPKLTCLLIEKGTINNIEKFSTLVLDMENLPKAFMKQFTELILPKLSKASTQHFNIEILLKMYRNYKDLFRNFILRLLISIKDMNSTLFHDFSLSLEPKEKAELLSDLVNSDINQIELNFLLPSFIVLYKDSDQILFNQNSLLTLMHKFREELSTNKDFGRLTLYHLQSIHKIITEKDCNLSFSDLNIDFKSLESIIETNKSAFRKPCLTLLQKLQMHFS